MTYRPLADEIRPQTLDEVVGQRHILGKDGLLRRIIDSGSIPNLVFYGPSGTGKTTVANIIARRTNRPLHRLNATTASISDIKDIIKDIGTMLAPDGVLLYLDEIQYFNKKQQQSLLEFMENGKITLIASTTENPYFYVYNAVLSRSTVFEFKPIEAADVRPAVERGIRLMGERLEAEVTCEDGGGGAHLLRLRRRRAQGHERGGAAPHLRPAGGGHPHRHPGRRSDGGPALRHAVRPGGGRPLRHRLRPDEVPAGLRPGRGPPLPGPPAGGRGHDHRHPPHPLLRQRGRGHAYPQAALIAKACVDNALQLGLPEAQLPLAQAVILLATAPKSNSVYMGIAAARADVRAGKTGDYPRHLQNVHADSAGMEREQGYLYPHDFPRHWVRQQYLPDILAGTRYYQYGDNKNEQAARRYWEEIKGPDA